MFRFAWFVLADPMKTPTAATPGSWRRTSATCAAFWLVLLKDASCEVTMTPLMKPVSCWGKNPVGVMT